MSASSLHVVQSIASLDPAKGGTTRTVIELACAVAAAGVRTSIWTHELTDISWIPGLAEQGIAVEPIKLEVRKLAPPSDNLVIHSHGVWLPVNHRMAVFAARRGIARVVSPRGMLEPWALNHRRWKKRVAWALYQRRDLERAASLHATSQMEAENMRRLGLNRPIFTVPNGINDPGSNWKAAPAIQHVNGVRTAVFLSRIHPKKGLPLLAEAWARVRPQGWRMAVVGPDEGGHRAEVSALIGKLGLGQSWELRDAVSGDAKWRLLAEADLSILPTYSENFGNVVPESLLVGTPVITTTGAPWQGLIDQRCGWWVEPSIEGIEAALRAATSLPRAEVHEMGQRGREWARHEFAWPGIAHQMIAAYEDALSEDATTNARVTA